MINSKIDLSSYVDEIRNLDWGCGCCGSSTEEELKRSIKKVLEDLVKELEMVGENE